MKKYALVVLAALCAAPLPAAPIFMGVDLAAVRSTDEDAHHNALLSAWMQDVRQSRKDGILSTCSAQDVAAAQQAVTEAVLAARRAYAAQMDFALYSLEPLRETHPERYRLALQQYRNALYVLYNLDAAYLRNGSVLTPSEGKAGSVVHPDAFAEAMLQRINAQPDYRSGYAELEEHLNQRFLQRVDFVANLLAGDRPPAEFLTNTPLDSVPEDYAETCQTRFLAAFAAWHRYVEAAVQLHCPVPSLQGIGSSAAMDTFRQTLRRHFEAYLTLLVAGLGK